jgi:ubiquinone/menaquinone biosynthesis C-methylase UbiE
MGWYSRVVFPRLCDFLLNKPFVARQRRELLALAHEDVLEIGFGTGLNLACYPPHVRKITAVDPNSGMQRLAKKRTEQSGIAVDYQAQRGERLTFASGSFDCVVSTFTLCSIEHVAQALREIHRVLKPGGRFLFLEHGLSPEPGVRKWQKRLNWLEMRVADGCHLDRNMRDLVAAEPFASIEVKEFYLDELPGTHGYMYRGAATK